MQAKAYNNIGETQACLLNIHSIRLDIGQNGVPD
jgi:hypothetical protein